MRPARQLVRFMPTVPAKRQRPDIGHPRQQMSMMPGVQVTRHQPDRGCMREAEVAELVVANPLNPFGSAHAFRNGLPTLAPPLDPCIVWEQEAFEVMAWSAGDKGPARY